MSRLSRRSVPASDRGSRPATGAVAGAKLARPPGTGSSRPFLKRQYRSASRPAVVERGLNLRGLFGLAGCPEVGQCRQRDPILGAGRLHCGPVMPAGGLRFPPVIEDAGCVVVEKHAQGPALKVAVDLFQRRVRPTPGTRNPGPQHRRQMAGKSAGSDLPERGFGGGQVVALDLAGKLKEHLQLPRGGVVEIEVDNQLDGRRHFSVQHKRLDGVDGHGGIPRFADQGAEIGGSAGVVSGLHRVMRGKVRAERRTRNRQGIRGTGRRSRQAADGQGYGGSHDGNHADDHEFSLQPVSRMRRPVAHDKNIGGLITTLAGGGVWSRPAGRTKAGLAVKPATLPVASPQGKRHGVP